MQVVTSSGASGHNVEYVLRLADWFRSTLPGVRDDHLFTLEMHVRHKIKERNLCVKAMMREMTTSPIVTSYQESKGSQLKMMFHLGTQQQVFSMFSHSANWSSYNYGKYTHLNAHMYQNYRCPLWLILDCVKTNALPSRAGNAARSLLLFRL